MANGRIVSNSGRNIQLQNLPKNYINSLEDARELLKIGCFDAIDFCYGNTADILSQLIRTMLIPKPDYEFIVCDFSAIEARVLAWLADENWRLKAFERGDDIYCASASAMFKKPVVKNGVNGELRQRGKVAELACIAYDNLVKTTEGLVPITMITKNMRVWDGERWVKHHGVIFKGEKPVLKYKGLTATPDHVVYTPDGYPVRFGDLPGESAGVKPVYDILKAGPKHRYTVSGWLVHNCGYGGSSGALAAMGALDMGLTEDELKDLVADWRKANPNIVKFWWNLENAAKEAFDGIDVGDGKKIRQESMVGKIEVSYSRGILFLTLPSGRSLTYMNPKITTNNFGGESISYKGLNAANKWVDVETYGGKLAENVTQATSRDLLAEVMWRMEKAGLEIVGHVHDEVVLEVPKNSISVDEVREIMNTLPDWAEGLPIDSNGYKGNFYFKD